MLKIGQLAKHSGISAGTIRFYEKQGLIAPATRSDAGYRMYEDSQDAILKFIVTAKSIGFTLQEIKELLSIELNKSSHSCESVKELVDVKYNLVQRKISELKHMSEALKKLSNACCGGDESAEHCSILTALESGNNTS